MIIIEQSPRKIDNKNNSLFKRISDATRKKFTKNYEFKC